MKRASASIYTAIFLLGFFVCGQWLAFGHSHSVRMHSKQDAPVLTEKCQICDQLISFDAVLAPAQVCIQQPAVPVQWCAAVFMYSFSSITEGSSRAPPAA